MAQVFQFAQQIERLLGIALVEGDAREHQVAQDQVVRQADVAAKRHVHMQQPGVLRQVSGLVDPCGVQHAGPGIAIGLSVGALARGANRHAKARTGLAHAPFLQIDDAFDRFGIH
ncbi:hypothetical protein D3C87_1672650 [compost metagenome]